jgi:hypothetical protein
VVWEHKQELEVASPVILVEHHVQELHLRQNPVVLQSYTADGQVLEHGVDVQRNVVLEQ